MRLEVLKYHSVWRPLSDWLINGYLLTSFRGPWNPLKWNAVPNYPLVIMVILPNGMRASYLDTLNGTGRKVRWDEGEPVLNPEGPTACLNRRPRHTVCHVLTKRGVPYCDKTRHACAWLMSQIWRSSRKELGCYKQHLLLNQATEPSVLTFSWFHTKMTVSAAWCDLKAQTGESSMFASFPGDTCECFCAVNQISILGERKQSTAW